MCLLLLCCVYVCVPILKVFAGERGIVEDMCYERRRAETVWTSLPIPHCCEFFVVVCVYYCSTYCKAVRVGGLRNPVLFTKGVALFSLVPLVRESNPKLQGGWCKTQPPAMLCLFIIFVSLLQYLLLGCLCVCLLLQYLL